MKSSLAPLFKISSGFIILTSVFAACSSKENETRTLAPTPQEKVNAQRKVSAAENTQMVSAAIDVFEVTSAALVAKGVAGGKISSFGSKTSDDTGCLPAIGGNFSLSNVYADSTVFTGTLMLDYGDGSGCSDVTQNRKGKITDSFHLVLLTDDGSKYSLVETVTFEGFQTDSVQIDGKFIGTSSPGKTSIKVIDSKLTYQDGSFASLNASLYSNLVINASGVNVSKEVLGSLSGTTSDGLDFSASATTAIVYDYSCSPDVPVTGTINISIGGEVSKLDYGSGVCDNKYMITTNDSIIVGDFQYTKFK